MGGDVQLFEYKYWVMVFQFTPPRGGRPIKNGQTSSNAVSIHAPAWGATETSGRKSTKKSVSIHAPAWGATIDETAEAEEDAVSIHAPAWGATNCRMMCVMMHTFQFTPPRGGRLRLKKFRGFFWGFNSRPRVGGDLALGENREGSNVSIHAPAWGATYYGDLRGHSFRCFNSRPRVGGDYGRGDIGRDLRKVSIHAPAWGATR